MGGEGRLRRPLWRFFPCVDPLSGFAVAGEIRLAPSRNIPLQSSQVSRTPHSRTFIDDDGARWVVYEQRLTEYDRRSGPSLIFNSDFAVRRVRNYPENWMELSEAALLELSWQV